MKLQVFLLILLFSSVGFADNFFIPWDQALKKSEYTSLKKYYETHPDDQIGIPPDQCFRLNNNEYLVIVTATGRMGQGLYYLNLKNGTFELHKHRAIPGIEIVQEFIATNQKRYVLLKWSNLHHGDLSNGYDILNLVPKKMGTYELYNLFWVSEDPEVGLCGEWSSTDETGQVKHFLKIKEGKTQSIEGYEIKNTEEGTKIIFFIKEQDCKTLNTRSFKKTYTLSEKKFIEK